MKETVFTFPSFTYANKAKKMLQRANVYAKPVKLGPGENKDGCISGLSVSYKDQYTAIQLFMGSNIIYKVSKNGFGLSG